MLKAIYKFLLVTLLSGSLLMLDFGVKGAQLQVGFNHSFASTAEPQAQDCMGNTPEEAVKARDSEACKKYQSQNPTNSPNSNTPTNTNNEPNKKVKLDAAKDNDLMATLTMTAIGLLASRLYKCKLTTDMMIAAAGGAAYIAGDIVATFQLKSVMKDLEKEIKKTGTVTEANNQIEDFKRLKKSYEDAKGTANTKKMLQMAAAAAFLIAAGVAAYQYTTMKAAQLSCITGLSTSSNACAAQCATLSSNPATAASAPPFCTAVTPLASASALEIVRSNLSDMIQPSSTGQTADTAKAATSHSTMLTGTSCPLAAKDVAACKGSYSVELFNRGVCLVPPAVGLNSILNTPLFEKRVFANYTPVKNDFSWASLLISDARADLFSPLGIVSGLAISFVMMTSTTLGVQLDTMLFSPLNRGIIWGVLAGLTYMASTATDNQIKKIEENIQKIQAIIDELEALRKGNTTASALAINTGGTSPKATAVKSPEFNLGNGNYQDVDMSKEGVKFPCINGEYTNHCDSFSNLMNEKTQNVKDLPPDLKSQIANLSSLADGINGTSTLSTGTMANAASLAAQANALRSNLNSKQQKIQDMLNRNKNNKINLAARSNAIKNDMLKAVGKELEKRGSTPAKMLASFGASGSLSSKYAATSSYGDGSVNGVGAGDTGTGADGANGSETLDPSKIKNTAASIDIGQGSSELSEAAKAGSNETNGIDPLAGQSAAGANGKNADGTKTATMDDYDLKNDINLNKDVDIFKVITNRYQKSAYPRLFKRVK